MPNLMAMEITEEDYPLAKVLLGSGYAALPIEKSIGCYLLIDTEDSNSPCGWMTKEDFEKVYQLGGEIEIDFREVVKL